MSARPKPNRLVRTKASTSVMKQVGTYLHVYCKRLSQLREHLWSVPADREWNRTEDETVQLSTCYFLPSQMPWARLTGQTSLSSSSNQKASSNVMIKKTPYHIIKAPSTGAATRRKSLFWSSCSQRCWVRRRIDLPPAKVGELSYHLRSYKSRL